MTKAEIWNAAFGLLVADVGIGDPDSDTGMEADLARRTYDVELRALLEEHEWTFATVEEAALPELAGAATVDGSPVYALPGDYLATVRVFDDADNTLEYRTVNGGISLKTATSGGVNLLYIALQGETALPSYFTKALIEVLAARWAMPITSSADVASYWRKEARGTDGEGGSVAAAKRVDWQRAGQRDLLEGKDITVISTRQG